MIKLTVTIQLFLTQEKNNCGIRKYSNETLRITLFSDTLINLIIAGSPLTKEQQRVVYGLLASQVQTYQEFQDHSIDRQKGVGALTESIIKTYKLLLESMKME